MNPLVFGIVAGLIFGLLNAASMVPLQFPDKTAALAGAFFSRFAIGFLIPLVHLPLPSWLTGAVVGLLISVPDAIIAKAYAPIIVTGLLGGAVIGWLSGQYVTV